MRCIELLSCALHVFEQRRLLMLRKSLIIAAVLLFPAAIILLGCSKSAPPSGADKQGAKVGQNSAAPTDASAEPKGESAQPGPHDAEIAAVLATLSAEDRALVEKQQKCPVSGELLGLMGAPVKLDVQGQPVFICCENCREKLLADPDKYLAKLNK
jgi:hypothetical protein